MMNIILLYNYCQLKSSNRDVLEASNSHLTLFNTKTILFDWFVKWKEETLPYDLPCLMI